MGRDRAVVHDPPALRVLPAHPAESGAGAEEHAGDVQIDHGAELLRVHLVDEGRLAEGAGVVEEHVDPPGPVGEPVERRLDRALVGDVGGEAEGVLRSLRHLAQHLLPPGQQTDPPALRQEEPRAGGADARGGAGDQDRPHSSSSAMSESGATGAAFRSSIRRGPEGFASRLRTIQ